jgi:hypothetical protein
MLSLNKGPKGNIDMDQDELLANIREHLSNRFNDKDWQAFRQLMINWPDDTLPKVVADYIYSTAIEGRWEYGLSQYRITTLEQILHAPRIERQMEEITESIAQQVEAELPEVQTELIHAFDDLLGRKDILSLSVNRASLQERLSPIRAERAQKALSGQEGSYNLSITNGSWLTITLTNQDIMQTPDSCKMQTLIQLEDGIVTVLDTNLYLPTVYSWISDGCPDDWYEECWE